MLIDYEQGTIPRGLPQAASVQAPFTQVYLGVANGDIPKASGSTVGVGAAFIVDVTASATGSPPTINYGLKQRNDLPDVYTVINPLDQVIPSGSYIGLLHEPTYGVWIAVQLAPGDHKVLVDAKDTTPDYLADKIVAGDGITINLLNPNGDEQLEITTDPFVCLGPFVTSIDTNTCVVNSVYLNVPKGSFLSDSCSSSSGTGTGSGSGTGTGTGTGSGCDGQVYDSNSPGCCPGECWPATLTLTIGGDCPSLTGTYTLTLSNGTWGGTVPDYNGASATWAVSCITAIDPNGDTVGGVSVNLTWDADNSTIGSAVDFTTSCDPISASGTMKVREGPCVNVTLSWAVSQ
jgi:hypothetical protein